MNAGVMIDGILIIVLIYLFWALRANTDTIESLLIVNKRSFERIEALECQMIELNPGLAPARKAGDVE